MLDSPIIIQLYVYVGGKNHYLTPAHNWIHYCIQDWNMGLDMKVVSSLEYEYSVTCGATKAAWYSPCVIRKLGEASVRIMGGKVIWVVVWVCGRMFSWCEMVKAQSWGHMMDFCSCDEWA